MNTRHTADIIADLRARAHRREQDIRNNYVYPSSADEDKAVAECKDITLLREAADRLAHAMRPVLRSEIDLEDRKATPLNGVAWHIGAIASGEIEGK